jgi:hypothetical protein
MILIAQVLRVVLRVEMQSMKNDPTRSANPTIVSTFKHILAVSGFKGLFRGVVPRIGVAAWATIYMVGFGDTVEDLVAGKFTCLVAFSLFHLSYRLKHKLDCLDDNRTIK